MDTGQTLGPVKDFAATGDSWYKRYGWYWQEDTLMNFLEYHPNAFICGSAENIADNYGLFDHIITLSKTEAELHHNLHSPERTNPFGKTTQQREGFIDW